MKAKKDLETEKEYTPKQAAEKLRRLADAIERKKRFHIQIAGERVSIPPDAEFSIEHDRTAKTEEVEFEFTWKRK